MGQVGRVGDDFEPVVLCNAMERVDGALVDGGKHLAHDVGDKEGGHGGRKDGVEGGKWECQVGPMAFVEQHVERQTDGAVCEDGELKPVLSTCTMWRKVPLYI